MLVFIYIHFESLNFELLSYISDYGAKCSS